MVDRIDPAPAAVLDRNEGVLPYRDIEVDERIGSVRVRDPRIFRADHRAFCRRLLENVTRRTGVSKAEVDLASASCRISFVPGSASSQEMATVFSDAVHEAVAQAPMSERAGRWRRTEWFALTAYPLVGGVSLWEALEVRPGRIRLRHRALAEESTRISRLALEVAALPGVETCRVSRWSRAVTIEFSMASPAIYSLLDDVEQVLEDTMGEAAWKHSTRGESARDGAAPIPVATGFKRPLYLMMAGGSFTLCLLGIVVPGLPTVPFLLATSYFLARSSRTLDERLRRTRFFGPILSEWEECGGLSRRSKGKLIGLSASIIFVTVLLAPLSPIALGVILIFGSMSIYGIAELPNAPDKSDDASALAPASTRALPAM